jgi:hypothetical protein
MTFDLSFGIEVKVGLNIFHVLAFDQNKAFAGLFVMAGFKLDDTVSTEGALQSVG